MNISQVQESEFHYIDLKPVNRGFVSDSEKLISAIITLAFLSSSSSSSSSSEPELTPEEKARGLARAIRKQTGEVRERWERLKGHVGGWQSQVERALERLQELQSSMDQLDLRLTRAEEAKATWQPVGDLLIDSLQDHIEKTGVSVPSLSRSSRP